jgi:hypothetical protein
LFTLRNPGIAPKTTRVIGTRTRNDLKSDNQFGETGRTKEINKQNRLLDRALKGICRRC